MKRLSLLAVAVLLLAFQAALLAQQPSAQQPKTTAQPAHITTPKEHLGFNLGDDYCLANYQQLVSYWAKLEQQSQHKSRLMSALSHDARTPLNAVVLSAKLLESHSKDQDDPEVQECLETIRNAVRNVRAISVTT